MKRHKMSRRHSRKVFTKYARGAHIRNYHAHPVRGGFRI